MVVLLVLQEAQGLGHFLVLVAQRMEQEEMRLVIILAEAEAEVTHHQGV